MIPRDNIERFFSCEFVSDKKKRMNESDESMNSIELNTPTLPNRSPAPKAAKGWERRLDNLASADAEPCVMEILVKEEPV